MTDQLNTPTCTLPLELVTSIYLFLSDASFEDFDDIDVARELRAELHAALSYYKGFGA